MERFLVLATFAAWCGGTLIFALDRDEQIQSLQTELRAKNEIIEEMKDIYLDRNELKFKE